MWWSKILELALLPVLVHSFASTDSIQDVDPAQSGYLPNHNMNPSVITGGTFGISWKNTYNTNEKFYAKPLVYTPSGAPNEYVIIVSSQNIVRIIDGFTGALINSRTLDPPFASSDTSCPDIPNTVGITGTPIIDSATDIMYFYSKGYQNGLAGPQGTLNGQYKFYAINIPSLTDVSGFPIGIDGNFANNDPTRYFVGGTILQRPALTSVGDIVLAGFGGHCDNFNYTGMLVAVSKTRAVVTNVIAMEAQPGAPSPQPLDYTVQGGGKGGIWQTGMGLATDGNRIFFVTGNGKGGGGQNGGGVPASGFTYLSTLEQAVANFGVDPSTGNLTQIDYFEPYEYQNLDGGDKDFGSSGACLLDPTTFSGTGVNRIVVAGGKTGKVYVLNADNLGGFAQGTGGTDQVIQTILNSHSLFSGVGSYPLEGGYFYYNPTGDFLYAYKMGFDGTGAPFFTLAGKSAATYVGKSVPTVTSLNGQAGTGIVWISDVNIGLVAFNAVPVNGVMQTITLPAVGRLQKYQRPAFGNGRVYVHGTGTLIALGTPVILPLSCSGPINFGSVNIGQTSTVQINCTAKTAVTINGCYTGLATFQCQNSSLPSTVASGGKFSFPVTFNLTSAAIDLARDYDNVQVLPGNEGAALNLYASASASGYVKDTPIQLTGTVVASQGFLVINATQVDFGGIDLSGSVLQSSSSVILSNQGSSTLTITGLAWQDMNVNGMPFQNVSVQPANQPTTVGNGFTAMNFPAINSQLAQGQSITIPLVFSPTSSGGWASLLTFWSDGGSTDVMLSGAATNSSSTSTTSSSTTSSTSTSSTLTSSISTSTSITSTSSTLTSTSTSTSITSTSSTLTTSTSTSTSSTSSTSSTTSTSSSTTSTGPSTNTATTTTSSSSSSTTSTTATITTTSSAYQYIGCFRDISVGHALPLLFANNSVTPELCIAYAQSLAAQPTPTSLPYVFVEYHRECYGGSSFAFGTSGVTSLTGAHACTDVCSGSIGASTTGTAFCGGSKQFNLYATGGSVSWPNPPATSSL